MRFIPFGKDWENDILGIPKEEMLILFKRVCIELLITKKDLNTLRMTTFQDTIEILEEIRKYKNLQIFQKEKAKDLCKEYCINEGQLSFLISVVAAERIKENKIL